MVTLDILKQYLSELESRLERQHRAELEALTATHATELQALEERIMTNCAQQQATKLRRLGRAWSKQRQAHRSLKKTKLEMAMGCVDLKRSNKKNLYFKGCNVWIQNGKGKTKNLNGQGNLILGYNENTNCITTANCVRSGSHNLVVGPNHEYASYGGIVAGDTNSAIGIASTVAGGTQGEAQGDYSSVTGGFYGWAAGNYSSVTAGDNGAAFGIYAAVHGGFYNTASGGWSSILGGDYNYATSPATSATITGGQENHAESSYATIHGGLFNFVQSKYGVVLGGQNNTIGPGFNSNYTTLPPIMP